METNTNKKKGAALEPAKIGTQQSREQLLRWKVEGTCAEHDFCYCGHNRLRHKNIYGSLGFPEDHEGICRCGRCSRGRFTWLGWK